MDLQLISISTFDFAKKYASYQQSTPIPQEIPGSNVSKSPLVSDIVPLNRSDTVLITIEKKRYLVYDYIQGEVIKEILPLRGSAFKACSDFMFHIHKQPFIIFYNATSIRRVDIQTFEIKKNIDLHKINGPGMFPFVN